MCVMLFELFSKCNNFLRIYSWQLGSPANTTFSQSTSMFLTCLNTPLPGFSGRFALVIIGARGSRVLKVNLGGKVFEQVKSSMIVISVCSVKLCSSQSPLLRLLSSQQQWFLFNVTSWVSVVNQAKCLPTNSQWYIAFITTDKFWYYLFPLLGRFLHCLVNVFGFVFFHSCYIIWKLKLETYSAHRVYNLWWFSFNIKHSWFLWSDNNWIRVWPVSNFPFDLSNARIIVIRCLS